MPEDGTTQRMMKSESPRAIVAVDHGVGIWTACGALWAKDNYSDAAPLRLRGLRMPRWVLKIWNKCGAWLKSGWQMMIPP
jgi:hypothetical protein